MDDNVVLITLNSPSCDGNIKTRTDNSVVILKAIELALLLLLIILIRLMPASKTPSETLELVDWKVKTNES